MSDEQTQCTLCGARILVLTAQEHGGRCVPCARGEREQIEAGRRRYFEDKAFRQSPPWLYWRSLMQRDFETLPETEKRYVAVGCLRGEVLNGGFDSFFRHNSMKLARYAEHGLEAMGAERALAILREAMVELPSARFLPESWSPESMRRHLDDPAIEARLSKLDEQFWEETEALWDLMMAYGAQQGFFPPADEF